jgi:hypothetical protein
MPGLGKPMISMTTNEVNMCLTLKKSHPIPLIEDNITITDNDNDSVFFYSDSDYDDDDNDNNNDNDNDNDDDNDDDEVLFGLQFDEADSLNGPIEDPTLKEKLSEINSNLDDIDLLLQILDEKKRKKLMEEKAVEIDVILQGMDSFVQILVERKKKKNKSDGLIFGLFQMQL